MLEAINLSKKYAGEKALSGLILKVNAGEIFCLLGANGAGKTTTINLFMGFIKPSSGQVLVDGKNVVDYPSETKNHIAYIPENLHLYGNLTGIENLKFFTGLGGNNIDSLQAEALLREAGLQADAHAKRVVKYSKGMRQKVGIAIARAKEAQNLLLDEPTSGLDPQASSDFANLLENLRESNVAILMATHDLFRAKESGTHIGIMREGTLVHTMKSDEITLKDLEELYLETMKTENNAEVDR